MSEETPDATPTKNFAERTKDAWTVISTIGTVLTFILGGVLWVNSKFEEFEQRGADIQDLQEMNQKILNDTADLKSMISQVSQNTAEHIGRELDARDKTDIQLQASITAVLNEVRARHGIVPLADIGDPTAERPSMRVNVRAASENAEENIRASGVSVMREERPLAGLRLDL